MTYIERHSLVPEGGAEPENNTAQASEAGASNLVLSESAAYERLAQLEIKTEQGSDDLSAEEHEEFHRLTDDLFGRVKERGNALDAEHITAYMSGRLAVARQFIEARASIDTAYTLGLAKLQIITERPTGWRPSPRVRALQPEPLSPPRPPEPVAAVPQVSTASEAARRPVNRSLSPQAAARPQPVQEEAASKDGSELPKVVAEQRDPRRWKRAALAVGAVAVAATALSYLGSRGWALTSHTVEGLPDRNPPVSAPLVPGKAEQPPVATSMELTSKGHQDTVSETTFNYLNKQQLRLPLGHVQQVINGLAHRIVVFNGFTGRERLLPVGQSVNFPSREVMQQWLNEEAAKAQS